MRIESIRFASGPSGKQDSLLIHPGIVTLIVGPNNSGKSSSLKEIETHLSGVRGKPLPKILIESVVLEYPENITNLRKMFEQLGPTEIEGREDQFLVPDPQGIGSRELERRTVEWSHIENWHRELKNAPSDDYGNDFQLRQDFVRLFCIRLDAVTRLSLVRSQEIGDQYKPPPNYLDRLLREDKLRKKVREVVLRAFSNHYFIIDHNGSRLQIRLGGEAPDRDFERRRGPEQAKAMDEFKRIDEYGDGIKAFVGMVAGIVALGQKFILIDDPEAFLHPPVARVFGQSLIDIATSRNAQVFISTHSPELVMGCLESSDEVGIVRLTYNDIENTSTARQINPSSLNALMKDRLLRSTGVFNGVFHRGVVITESEEDKVFYDEINRRLVNAGRGNRDTLFLNAQNWSTTGEIAGPLREVGVPSAIIIDVDVLRRPASEWRGIKQGCFLPKELGKKIGNLAHRIRKEIPSKKPSDTEQQKREKLQKKKKFKRIGLNVLTSETRELAEDLTYQLSEYGVFVVQIGQLESWLRSFGVESKKSKGVRETFSVLESRDTEPGETGIWEFIDNVANWLSHPKRGMTPP